MVREINAGEAVFRLRLQDLISGQLKKPENRINEFGKRVTAIGNRFTEAARALSLFTAGIAAPAALGVREYARFEHAMSRVSALTEASAEEFTKLSARARELGRTTVFTATQAAEAMGNLARAGFSVEEVMSAIKPALDLSAAGAIDLADGANIIVRIMRGMQVSASRVGEAVDILAKAMSTANTDIYQLGEAFKFVAPVATAFGLDLAETTAIIQSFSDAGIQAELAGTTLRGIIATLTGPSKEAAKVMKDLGVTIKDQQGNTRNFIDIIADLQMGLEGLGSGEVAESLSRLFPNRQLAGAFRLISEGEGKIRDMVAALRDAEGSADFLATEQLNNIVGDFTLLRSVLTDVGITFTSTFADSIRSTIQRATELSKAIGDWIKQNQDAARTVGLAAAGLVGLSGATFAAGVALRTLGFSLSGFSAAFDIVQKLFRRGLDTASIAAATNALAIETAAADAAAAAIAAKANAATSAVTATTALAQAAKKEAAAVSAAAKASSAYAAALNSRLAAVQAAVVASDRLVVASGQIAASQTTSNAQLQASTKFLAAHGAALKSISSASVSAGKSISRMGTVFSTTAKKIGSSFTIATKAFRTSVSGMTKELAALEAATASLLTSITAIGGASSKSAAQVDSLALAFGAYNTSAMASAVESASIAASMKTLQVGTARASRVMTTLTRKLATEASKAKIGAKANQSFAKAKYAMASGAGAAAKSVQSLTVALAAEKAAAAAAGTANIASTASLKKRAVASSKAATASTKATKASKAHSTVVTAAASALGAEAVATSRAISLTENYAAAKFGETRHLVDLEMARRLNTKAMVEEARRLGSVEKALQPAVAGYLGYNRAIGETGLALAAISASTGGFGSDLLSQTEKELDKASDGIRLQSDSFAKNVRRDFGRQTFDVAGGAALGGFASDLVRQAESQLDEAGNRIVMQGETLRRNVAKEFSGDLLAGAAGGTAFSRYKKEFAQELLDFDDQKGDIKLQGESLRQNINKLFAADLLAGAGAASAIDRQKKNFAKELLDAAADPGDLKIQGGTVVKGNKAFAAAVIAQAIRDEDAIRSSQAKMAKTIKESAKQRQNLFHRYQSKIKTIANTNRGVIGFLAGSLASAPEGTKGLFKNLGEGANQATGKVGGLLAPLKRIFSVGSKISKIGGVIKSAIKNPLVNAAVAATAVGVVFSRLTSVFGDIGTAFRNTFGGFGTRMAQIFGGIKDAIVGQNFGLAAQIAGTALQLGFLNAIEKLPALVGSILKAILKAIYDFVVSIPKIIKNVVKAVFNAGVSIGQALGNGIASAFGTAFAAVNGTLGSHIDETSRRLDELIGKANSLRNKVDDSDQAGQVEDSRRTQLLAKLRANERDFNEEVEKLQTDFRNDAGADPRDFDLGVKFAKFEFDKRRKAIEEEIAALDRQKRSVEGILKLHEQEAAVLRRQFRNRDLTATEFLKAEKALNKLRDRRLAEAKQANSGVPLNIEDSVEAAKQIAENNKTATEAYQERVALAQKLAKIIDPATGKPLLSTDTLERELDAAKKELDKATGLEQAEDIAKSLRTPAEIFMDAIKEAERIFADDPLNQERAIDKALEEFNRNDPFSQKLQALADGAEGIRERLAGEFNDFRKALEQGIEQVKFGLLTGQELRRFAAQEAQQILGEAPVIEELKSATLGAANIASQFGRFGPAFDSDTELLEYQAKQVELQGIQNEVLGRIEKKVGKRARFKN